MAARQQSGVINRNEPMGTTYRFLATADESERVLDWLRGLPDKPIESECEDGVLFYFRDFGNLDTDAKKSPVVTVLPPVQKRGVLTTIGEVHFLATPLSTFPKLNQVSTRFGKWLSQNPCIYSHRPDFVHEWDYFLEGSVKNWDSAIYAFPAGMAALRRGSYFVAADDNDSVLDRVCRALELRGVEGVQRPAGRRH